MIGVNDWVGTTIRLIDEMMMRTFIDDTII